MREFYGKFDMQNALTRLIEAGGSLSDEEVLMLLLDKLSPVRSAAETADELLSRYGVLEEVLKADAAELAQIEGVGVRGAQILKGAWAASVNVISGNSSNGMRRLFLLEDVVNYMRPKFLGEQVEKLYLLMLSPMNKVAGTVLVAQGDASKVVLDKKLIIEQVVRRRAKTAVLAHNHFTGLLPSSADVAVTKDVYELLQLLDVELTDHIIFCENGYRSMRQSGYFDFTR